jgi:hypothetical protein
MARFVDDFKTTVESGEGLCFGIVDLALSWLIR